MVSSLTHYMEVESMLNLNHPITIKSALVVIAFAVLFTVGARKVIASCCGPVIPPGVPHTCRAVFSNACEPFQCVVGSCVLTYDWNGFKTGATVSCASCGDSDQCLTGNGGCCGTIV